MEKDGENSEVTNVSKGDACTVVLDVSLTGNVEVNGKSQEIADRSEDVETQIKEVQDTVVIDNVVPVADTNLGIIDKPTLEPIEINTPEEDCNPNQSAYSEKIDGASETVSDSAEKNEDDDPIRGMEDLPKGESFPTSEQSNTVKNQTKVDTEIRASLEKADNKALNENILSKTTELIESMETRNVGSASTKQNMVDIQTESDKPAGCGLSLLAQYKSDSDRDSNAGDADCEDDDVMEIPLEASKDYRNQVFEIKSESESESSSSDDSDLEYLTTIRKEIQKTIDIEDDEDDDEDDDGTTAKGKKKKKQTDMRVKGELLLEDLPPIQDLHITVPEEECVELGKVHSIVDQLLLVSVLPDSLLLDLETVLFLEKGKRVLGEVFDVLGQVADPLYCVRFNSNKEIEEKGIKVGDTVYVAPKTQYTQFVILSNLMKLRGSDASWENDVEPPPRYIDYSDDEQEREANARLRNQDRPKDHDDPAKRSRSNNDSDVASSSSISSSQPSHSQDIGRFNRNRVHQNRPPYQRNQIQPNAAHRGSWHSNYRQPYSSYSNMHMMPQQAPNNMQSLYQSPSYQPYIAGPFSNTMPPPQMSPIARPSLLPMYVLNPLAVAPPRRSNNINQRIPQSRHSPPPAPPGLD